MTAHQEQRVRRLAPVEVEAEADFELISAGGQHTCALDDDGAAWCWGTNTDGMLGNGDDEGLSPEPVEVAGDHEFTTLDAGANHTCALTEDGEAFCWGLNQFGALGDGTQEVRTEPTAVAGEHTFTAVTAGLGHSCGITEAGAALCWGFNAAAQLGNGTTANALEPAAVEGGYAFAILTAGDYHTCGVTEDGLTICWGLNPDAPLGATSTESLTRAPPPAG